MGEYSAVTSLNEPSSPLEKFAKKVFDKLISEGVPPLPSYYRVYFFNLLEEEPASFRKQIYELISLEETQDADQEFEKEKKIKESFKYTKELLQHTALLYKTTMILKQLLSKQLGEIKHITSPKVLEKLVTQLQTKLDAIDKKLAKENEIIKKLYAKTVSTIKELESNSTFDSTYGVYNKNYFLKLVEKEIQLIEKFSHISTVLVLRIREKILKNLSPKEKIIANRSLAKMLLKTSRRTDEIGYLGDDTFAMLLRNTDRIGARKTMERISDMLSTATIFLGEEELDLEIVGGLAEIREKLSAVEYVKKAIAAMKKADEEGVLYIEEDG